MMILWALICAALAGATSWTADEAVAEAAARSPALAAAEAEIVRAEGALRAARGMRQAPEIGAELAVVGDAWSIEASQALYLTGEGFAAQVAARHALEAAVAKRRRAELELAAEVRRAWVAAVADRQQAALARRALEVAQRIEGAAQERAAVGEASRLDLGIARLQLEQARTAWMGATVADGHSAAALAVLVGREAATLELPEDPLAGAPMPGEERGRERSDLSAADAALSSAEAALARERAATLPPVQLGAFVEQDGAELRAGPSLSLTLPLWQANVDGRSDALAGVAEASAARDAVERQARAEQASTARVSAALEEAVAGQSVDLPAEARAALDSVSLGYDRGELDLLSVALLQTEILEGQAAWLAGRRLVTEARIDAMLAHEDPELLGGCARR